MKLKKKDKFQFFHFFTFFQNSTEDSYRTKKAIELNFLGNT